MDFEFIREQTPLYIEAAKLTLHMAVIGVLLAIVVGLVCLSYSLLTRNRGCPYSTFCSLLTRTASISQS